MVESIFIHFYDCSNENYCLHYTFTRNQGYRNRVCSALAVYHGNSEGTEKKSGKKSREESRLQNSSSKKPSEKLDSSSASAVKTETGKNVAATSSYKDPLASAKLEMIKRIKIQRTAMETEKREVTLRAK